MLKHLYLFATAHRIVSRTSVQIHGEAPDPWPVPKILLIWLLRYTLADKPWPVFNLYIVFWRIWVSIIAEDLGRPILLQHIIA